jgi:hypothetical protein
MIAIKRAEIIDAVVAYYQRQLKESTMQLYYFQQRYNCSLEDFKQQIEESETEVHGRWEDYISWKGHQASAADLANKIQKIADGLFEIA